MDNGSLLDLRRCVVSTVTSNYNLETIEVANNSSAPRAVQFKIIKNYLTTLYTFQLCLMELGQKTIIL